MVSWRGPVDLNLDRPAGYPDIHVRRTEVGRLGCVCRPWTRPKSDKDNWPDFANRQLTQDLDAHYGIERRRPGRGAAVDVRVGREGVDVDVEPRPRERAR